MCGGSVFPDVVDLMMPLLGLKRTGWIWLRMATHLR